MPKITFMGAGSTVFTKNVLGDSVKYFTIPLFCCNLLQKEL